MKPASLFFKATLASVAYAQLETIQQAIGAVSDALGQLDTKVKAISGTDVNSAAPVLQASQQIQMTMQASTAKVNGAQALGVFDALSLQDTANSLVASVNQTMADLTAKKPQLDSLGVTQVAVQSIQDQKTAAKGLGDAIVSKVPSVGQGIAQGSIDQINSALEGGIKALSAGAGTSGGKGGAGTGSTMGGGNGRNASSNGTNGSGGRSGGRTGGRNSTSSNSGAGTGAALNPAQPADAADGPSNMMTSSAAAMPGMMTSSAGGMPGMPGMSGMPGMPGMMSTPAAAMPEMSSATTTMAAGSAQSSSSMKAGSGAASMGSSPAVALIGGMFLGAVIGVF
ncbi:hypothetical protein PG990_009782 [Apiospora arundinis]